MVDVARIGILRRPVVVAGSKPPAGASNSPWSLPDKALARHRGKGVDDCARPDIGGEPQFLRVPATGLVDRLGHQILVSDRRGSESFLGYSSQYCRKPCFV